MLSHQLQYDDEHRPKRFVQMTANPVAKKQDLTMDINMPFGPLSDEQEDDYELPLRQNKKTCLVMVGRHLQERVLLGTASQIFVQTRSRALTVDLSSSAIESLRS